MIAPESLRRHRGRNGCREGGAAAVEMAIVLPLLLFILMAMIDFGRGFNAQIQLSQAAREGVRLASLNGAGSPTDATNPFGNAAILARVQNAAAGVSGVTATTTYCSAAPGPTDTATVIVTSSFTWITGVSGMSKFFGAGTFPTPTTVRATGVMRCSG